MLTAGTPSGGYFSGKWVSANGYFHPRKAGAGNFTIFYNFVDTNQCINKAPATITLLDTAKLTSTQIGPMCTGKGVIYLDNVKPGGGVYNGKGVKSDTFSVATAGQGNHAIKYSLTNAKGCKSYTVFNILINKPDSISVVIKDKACQYDGSFLVHTYPSGGILKGSAVVGQSFYPLFANKGVQWVFYTITDSHQCLVIDSAKIYVSEAPVAKFLPFSSMCDNDKDFILKGGQPADSGKYYVEGKLDDIFSPATRGKGVYKIEYKVVNYFGCRDSAIAVLRVNASPLKPMISILKNTLTSSAVKGNQWLDKNGVIAGAIQQNYNPPADGYYFVKVTNDSNCSRTSDSVQFMKVGVRQPNKSNIFIYPNPSDKGMFYLEGLQNNSEIKVVDPVGRELFLYKNQNSKAFIDLSNIGKGTYFINVKIDGQLFNYRVVIILR